MIVALALGSLARAASCQVLSDGRPVDGLDCETISSWVLSCDVPEASGKLRVRASIAEYGLETEARLPTGQTRFQLALTGPKLRPGDFDATKPTGALVVGQPASFTDFCPLMQPHGVAGQRTRLPLDLVVSSHRQTGFAEETMEGGVVRRVPTYDEAGTPLVKLSVPTLQKTVGEQPPASVLAPPLDEDFTGQLQLADGAGAWHTLAWTGHRKDVVMDEASPAATLHLSSFDFPAADVAAVAGGDPVAWIEADLKRWLAQDPTSYIGLAGFARSELPTPFGLNWSTKTRAGHKWQLGAADRALVALTQAGDTIRVVVAWRMTPLDPAAQAAIDDFAGDGLP